MGKEHSVRKIREAEISFSFSAYLRLCGLLLLLAAAAAAQVPSPRSVLGFTPGDDKTIADWGQITGYFAKLDKASPKVEVREIGRSTNGKPLIVAFISSAKNIKDLEKYRRISAKLADPRTIAGDAELADLIKNGKTIVSISCSIHSTEIVASQMSMNFAYELATATDADTREILDNTILLLIPSPNPDGIDIVADWYRKTLGTKSEGTAPPELYHHYAGHDDNRDWFMLNLAETQAITKLFWQQWFPQFVYDVHQQGQNASRFIIPPFYDPVNPRIAPSIVREVGLIGYKMAAKFRPQYLRNFYDYGKANLVKKPDEPKAFIVSAGQPNAEAVARFIEILMEQGVEVHEMTRELWVKMTPKADFHEMPLGGYLIFVNQPQKNNILSLFEKQVYPHRLLPNGEAEVPYDVAGWTLPLQMGVVYDPAWDIRDLEKHKATLKRLTFINQVRGALGLHQTGTPFKGAKYPLKSVPKIALYRGSTSSMDEGWTRLVLDTFSIGYRRLTDDDARAGNFVCERLVTPGPGINCDVVILPADSENTIVKGLSIDRYPAEFSGGIGDEGVENLEKYVENGGKLVCFDDSCAMVIKRFGLPLKNVLAGLKRSEFYDPGSIVSLDVDTRQTLAKGLAQETPAYFTGSSAFELSEPPPSGRLSEPPPSGGGQKLSTDPPLASPRGPNIKVIARYGPMLSGWTLGEKFRLGKIALAEVSYGKGSIVLFAFRPQHRGQSWATFPLIFNALEK